MDAFKELVVLLQNGGWLTLAAVFMYFAYKASIVGFICLGVYKGLSLWVGRHRSFEARVARTLETSYPLTLGEEERVLGWVRAGMASKDK